MLNKVELSHWYGKKTIWGVQSQQREWGCEDVLPRSWTAETITTSASSGPSETVVPVCMATLHSGCSHLINEHGRCSPGRCRSTPMGDFGSRTHWCPWQNVLRIALHIRCFCLSFLLSFLTSFPLSSPWGQSSIMDWSCPSVSQNLSHFSRGHFS